MNQAEKGARFRAMHERPGCFVIPNPWDPGSAHLLTRMGFEALATTSAGFAFSLAKRDNMVGRDEMLVHVGDIVAVTGLPVSADLLNGFGDSPETVAETVRLLAATGAVGCSIEDATGREEDPIYEAGLAAERVRAAAEAARSLPFPFVLTARAENYLHGKPDLPDTIARLQSFQEVGADVLFAPGVIDQTEMTTLVREVDRPVNAILALTGTGLSVADMVSIGVKRVSVGSALARAAYGAFLEAAREIQDHGTFAFAGRAVSYRDLSAMM